MIHFLQKPENRFVMLWLASLAVGLLLAPIVQAPQLPGGWLSYVALHTTLEVFSIAVGCMIFAVAWSIQSYAANTRLLILGTCALGVAAIDLLHMLSFPGMPALVTESSNEKAIGFWLAARTLLAAGMLLVAWAPHRSDDWLRTRSKCFWLCLSLWAVVGSAVAILWFPEKMPRTFIEGSGLTLFKLCFEYTLMLAYLLSAVGFYRHTQHDCELSATNLCAASVVFAMSEYLFTLYADVTDFYNFLGHAYKIIGFVFLYRATFLRLVQKPFLQLQEARSSLQLTLDTLPDILLEMSVDGTILELHSGQDKWPESDRLKVGQNIRDILPPEDMRLGLDALQLAATTGSARNIYLEVSTTRGISHFNLSISRKNSVGNHAATYLVLARDVTEQILQKQQLELESRVNALLLRLEESDQAREESVFVQLAVDGVCELLGSPVTFLQQFDASQQLESVVVSAQSAVNRSEISSLTLPADSLQRSTLVNEVSEVQNLGGEALSLVLQRFISVSVRDAERTRVVLAIANKPVAYSEAELRVLERVAEFVWRGIKLKRQESAITQLSSALGQSPYPVMITDTNSRVLYVNNAFSQVSGYSPLEVIGKTPHIMKSGLTSVEVYQDMWSKITRGQTWKGELINRKKDGTIYTEKAMIYPVRNNAGEIINYVAHKEDITEQRQVESRIHQLANYDQLTGLANREVLEERLKQIMQRGAESELPLTLLWLDLDNFKAVNDSLGHDAGNLLLVKVSNRLRQELGEHVTLSRVSGDGFVALLLHTDQQAAALLARHLLEVLQLPLRLNGRQISISASIGMSIYPGDADSVASLMMNAETAMYRVKMEGRNGVRFFSHDMQEHSLRALEVASALKQADMDREFHIVYQPQMSLLDQQFVGAEALVRWVHPVWGNVSPGEFIPIAEQSGRILDIGAWVLKRVTQQIRQWRDAGLGDFSVAVNLSALQFVQSDMVKNIIETVARAGIPARCLEVELTETVALNNPIAAGQAISSLRRAGFFVSIDDFGTGYSSMSYLKRFAVDKLKIDQSFIRELANDVDDQSIVTAIVQMAHSLGMKTIAEGVETEEQKRILQEKGCDQIQGYLYSRPIPADEFEHFVRRRRSEQS